MKKTIFAAVAALCLMAGEAVFAQTESAPAPAAAPKERPTLEQIAQRKTDRMAERLYLTDVQKKQVYEINLQQLKEMEAQREAMRKAREARAEQMKSILSTEQFVKWYQIEVEPLKRITPDIPCTTNLMGIHPGINYYGPACPKAGKPAPEGLCPREGRPCPEVCPEAGECPKANGEAPRGKARRGAVKAAQNPEE